MMRFIADQVTVTAAAGDDNPNGRTITAVAVPYGEYATLSDGSQVRFMQGSLPVDGKAPRVFMYHDSTKPVGIVAERVEVEGAMMAEMKISRTALGDEALTLAADGVMDVSVGVNPIRFDEDKQGRVTVYEAEWLELSLVPIPAYAGAQVVDVQLSGSIHHAADTVCDNSDTENQGETLDATPAPAEQPIEAGLIPTQPLYAQPKRQFAMPSAGEFLAAYHTGGDTWRRVNEAFVEAAKARETAFQAAAGDVLTTDTPGLLPIPVVAPVFQDLNYIRPVVAHIGARAMPDGGNSKTFIRPTWTTHPSVAAQSPELSGVSATTPVIAANSVSKTTLAGQVTLSVQDIDFTSPAAMEIILRDLAGQYLLQSDNVAADAISSGATPSGSTWTVTANDPTSLIDGLYDAAIDIMTATNFLPDTLFVSPDVLKKLGQQLDGDKRPVFPYAGAAGLMGVNAMGTANLTSLDMLNPLGLKLVADRNFANGTLYVARSAACEFYEQVRGIMTVDAPATLGKTFSYYGYVATFIADGDMVKYIVVS